MYKQILDIGVKVVHVSSSVNWGYKGNFKFFFLRKTSKPKNQLRSKNQLTKHKSNHKQKTTNKTQTHSQAKTN